MVARGDLAVEVGYASMTGLQKGLIRLARARNKVCITATQMLESMIHSPSPTRAEVSDVANAVMDGTDAVMLSAETAVGKYPVRAVRTMAELCIGAEKHETFRRAANYRLEDVFSHVDEAIAMAVMYVANHLDVTRDHRVDGVGLDAAVDVARALRHSGVRIHAPRGDAAPRQHVSRRLRRAIRRRCSPIRCDVARTACSTRCCRRAAVNPGISCCSRRATACRGGPHQLDADPHRAGRRARRRRVPDPIRKALVLPGAGARGAYQVGVLKAIAEHPAGARAESVQRSSAALRPARSTRPCSRAAPRNFERADRATWSTSGATSRRARSIAPTTGRC